MSQKLVEVARGELVECVHRGYVAVTDLEGNILYKLGDPNHVTYFRSAAKPIQALAVFESGAVDKYKFTDEEIAIFCASHAGEEQHTQMVSKILEKIGVDEGFLQCGVHAPLNKETCIELYKRGKKPESLHCNCSGKHSGMLAAAKAWGFSLENYRDINHPLQQQMLQLVADFAEVEKQEIIVGVDGCGVPVFGLPISRMALAFAKLSKPHKCLKQERMEAVKRITSSMIKHPQLIAGIKRFDTRLLEVTKGKLIGKVGAEGVFCVGLMNQGIGIAVKVEDGNPRALWPSVVHVLKQLKVLDAREIEQLKNFYPIKLKNFHKEVVGEIRPVFQLQPYNAEK